MLQQRRDKPLPEHKAWEAAHAYNMIDDDNIIHHERALGDPLYNAFVCPEFEDFMNHVMESLVEFLLIKYNREKLAEPCYTSVRNVFEQVLKNKTRDHTPRLFFLLCMLQREPEFQTTFRKMYNIHSDKPTLVARGKQETRFVQFICFLQHVIEQSLRTPYNKHNIVFIIRETNAFLMREYLMGTLKIKT